MKGNRIENRSGFVTQRRNVVASAGSSIGLESTLEKTHKLFLARVTMIKEMEEGELNIGVRMGHTVGSWWSKSATLDGLASISSSSRFYVR